jgi:hypothetical protein
LKHWQISAATFEMWKAPCASPALSWIPDRVTYSTERKQRNWKPNRAIHSTNKPKKYNHRQCKTDFNWPEGEK